MSMANAQEQDATAGLLHLLNAAKTDIVRPDPSPSMGHGPNFMESNVVAVQAYSNGSGDASDDSLGGSDGNDDDNDFDNSAESMRKLTNMLLSNRPQVDPLKNQGFGIVTPHQHDILSGRGNGANQHPGNIFFRNLIHKYKHHYIHTGPSEKKLITKRIVEEVQNRNPPGRFLKQNNATELWDCLDIDKVLKKTGQALREKAPELKKRAREDYKVKHTTSQESYFQNSRVPSVSSLITKRGNSKTLPTASSYNESTNMRTLSLNMEASSSSKTSLPFSFANSLDTLAFQSIPLANAPKYGDQGVGNRNDSFDMSRLSSVTYQVDRYKSIERLIMCASNDNASLEDIYRTFMANPDILQKVGTSDMVEAQRARARRPYYQHQQSSSSFHNKSNRSMMENSASVPTQPQNSASPHSHDVLFQDGMVVTNHPGSRFFCDQANNLLPTYKGTAVPEKRVENKIIAAIGSRWPPGRFLCAANGSSGDNSNWHVLSFDEALQATSMHLRRASRQSQYVTTPGMNDVLVMRGNSQHDGNIYFRLQLEKYFPEYDQTLSPHLKRNIAKKIIHEIESRGGRFLKMNQQINCWEPLQRENISSKVLQGLKECQKRKKEHQSKTALSSSSSIKHAVAPVLNYVTENVIDQGKNSDPPGVFHNYYTKITINKNENGSKDPPGQIASAPKSTSVVDTGIIKRPDSPGSVPPEMMCQDAHYQMSRSQQIPQGNSLPIRHDASRYQRHSMSYMKEETKQEPRIVSNNPIPSRKEISSRTWNNASQILNTNHQGSLTTNIVHDDSIQRLQETNTTTRKRSMSDDMTNLLHMGKRAKLEP
mmetsp:Transcript_9194/g.10106  ORF Transcript_9194/g.10106 Transcript_9194/m.10106 type:complete len:823 (+) Transcript_9194:173-2641(+)